MLSWVWFYECMGGLGCVDLMTYLLEQKYLLCPTPSKHVMSVRIPSSRSGICFVLKSRISCKLPSHHMQIRWRTVDTWIHVYMCKTCIIPSPRVSNYWYCDSHTFRVHRLAYPFQTFVNILLVILNNIVIISDTLIYDIVIRQHLNDNILYCVYELSWLQLYKGHLWYWYLCQHVYSCHNLIL